MSLKYVCNLMVSIIVLLNNNDVIIDEESCFSLMVECMIFLWHLLLYYVSVNIYL